MHDDGMPIVLVAPLDWGLGHATRCVPIINELLNRRFSVIIAACGPSQVLLRNQFPNLEIVDIPSYRIEYKKGKLLKWGILIQVPVLLKRIKNENRWLAQLIKSRKIDLIISDNRYGLYHPDKKSIFLTHQLYIQSGVSEIVNRIILRWHNRLLKYFSICWVPDWQEAYSIAGKLSHPPFPPPLPVEYIGILSRFKNISVPTSISESILVIISGPEPQRTEFEKILLKQLESTKFQTVIVRGLPQTITEIPVISEKVKIYNNLDTDALNNMIISSKFIITRAGYSTIMDLIKLRKHAIIVPTPGQPEQEYLAKHLDDKNWMFMVNQDEFELNNIIEAFAARNWSFPYFNDGNALSTTLDRFNPYLT